MRVCAFGSFDKGFDRSWILLEALEQSGAEIDYCHFDLWAGHRHKTQLFPWRWLLLAGRYLAGVIAISRRFLQSPRCDWIAAASAPRSRAIRRRYSAFPVSRS